MGGFGSGREVTRLCTYECVRVDIRVLAREGALTSTGTFQGGGMVFSGRGLHLGTIRWTVTKDDHPACSIRFEPRSPSYRTTVQSFPIVFTSCTYGGQRPWFQCPWCDRRAAIVYLAAGGFSCRRCAELPYRSQRQTEYDRALDRRDVWRAKFGAPPGFAPFVPVKPPRQHWRTFVADVRRLRDAEQRVGELFVRDSIPLLERLGVKL